MQDYPKPKIVARFLTEDTWIHASVRIDHACVITAAANRTCLFLYVYIISVSLKDLIIISVVITVDVKVCVHRDDAHRYIIFYI